MRGIRTSVIAVLAVGLLAGSAVGVTAQSSIVTGNISGGDDCEATPDGARFCTGGRFEFDDARLTGDYESTLTEVFGGEGLEEAMIATEEFRVTNEEGAWSGQSQFGFFLLDGEPISGGNNWLLTGEGGYEGPTAWVYTPFDGGSTRGIILEGRTAE